MSSEALQFGRYVLHERIAAGGMGEVYVGLQVGIGEFRRPVAVKLLLPHLSDDERIISMFLREARVAAQMTHANVAQVYDVGLEHDRYYIAMELVRGVSLSRLITGLRMAHRTLPWEQLTWIARGLAEGLHVAHEQKSPEGRPLGVVHRDVTPHNVLVSVDGAVKLTDFGIARVAEGDKLSRPGVVMGKLGYLAPEQLLGEEADRRVDIFAAGATLFHLAALERPFETPSGSLLDPSRTPRLPLRDFRPDLPRPLLEAIERAMHPDKGSRFATARELRLALPEVPPQDEALGALVREVCGAAVVELELKAERATRSHAVAPAGRDAPGGTRSTPAPPASAHPAASAAEVAVVPTVSISALRPSRWPLALGAAALATGLAALGVSLQRPAAAPPPPAATAPAPPPRPTEAPAPPSAPTAPEATPVASRPPTPAAKGRASLSVDASPWGEVWVDGQRVGETPLAEHPLPAGEHQVHVTNPETGKTSRQRLTLRPGEQRTLRVDLR